MLMNRFSHQKHKYITKNNVQLLFIKNHYQTIQIHKRNSR